jgi:hypothetical protein
MPEFHEAFGVKEGDPMYEPITRTTPASALTLSFFAFAHRWKPVEERVDVW